MPPALFVLDAMVEGIFHKRLEGKLQVCGILPGIYPAPLHNPGYPGSGFSESGDNSIWPISSLHGDKILAPAEGGAEKFGQGGDHVHHSPVLAPLRQPSMVSRVL